MNLINFLISPVYAQGSGEVVDIASQVEGFFGYECVAEFVTNLVDLAIILSGILLLVYLVWGGLQQLVSAADKGKVENAHKIITNALVGLAIVATSWAIWNLALTFLGIKGNICGANISLPHIEVPEGLPGTGPGFQPGNIF